MLLRYVGINEIINILETEGEKINLDNISNCVREKLIKPIIYLDTIPAYACEEKTSKGAAIAVGHCFLSGYWCSDQIVGLFDQLMHHKKITINRIIRVNELIEKPTMLSWNYTDLSLFNNIPSDLVNLKSSAENLDLKYFMLQEPVIYRKNILISTNEVKIIVDYLTGLKNIIFSKKTKDEKVLSETEHTSFLNTIGALLTLFYEKITNYNQTRLIDEIVVKFNNRGLGESTLQRRFKSALDSLKTSKVD